MPDSRRVQRVSTLLQAELSRLLLEAVADPRLGSLITIARVRVTPDLEHAIVGITVLGDASVLREALAALADASGYLRRALAGRMALRRVPSLRFVADEAVSAGDRVLTLLDNLPGTGTQTAGQEQEQDG
jgi:ribosome-binding factor A